MPIKTDWDKEQVIQQLQPMSNWLGRSPGTQTAQLSKIEQRYCDFYDISKEKLIPDVSHHMGYFDAYGFKLATHHYRPVSCRGTVFIFHGYFDHVGLYGHLIEFLLHHGFAVIAYDLPGHGLSSGEPVAIDHFAQYRAVLEKCLTLCRNKLTEPWFAIGQSTGAAVLTDFLFGNRFDRHNTPFQHWVYLAPLLRPYGWNTLQVLHTLFGRVLRTWKRTFMPNSHDSEFLRFLKDDDPLQTQYISVRWVTALRRWIGEIESSQPLDASMTIIQGPNDTTVDWRHNIPHFRELLPLAEIKILQTGHHQLANEAPAIRNKVFNLLLKGIEQSFVE